MTSRGPGDAWTPGGFSRHDAPTPPPVVSDNPAHMVPRPVDSPPEAPSTDYSPPRHSVRSDAPVPSVPIETEPAELPDRSFLDKTLRPFTHRSRMAALDAALHDSLRRMPPVYGKVAFVCAKGGVSKTVHTMVISAILSQYTSVPVAVVDFNPDQGTLGTRAAPRQRWGRTIRDLIDTITYGRTLDLDEFLTPHQSGASVVISGNTSLDAKDITAMQYESVMNVLHERFPLIVIDTGNSMTTEVYESVLRTVDQIVVIGQYSVDAAVTAANTHSRIRQAGGRLETIAYQALVSFMRPKRVNRRVNVGRIREHFADNTASGSIRETAWDAHLDEGGVIDVGAIAPATRREFTILAADIAAALSGEPLFSTTVLPKFL